MKGFAIAYMAKVNPTALVEGATQRVRALAMFPLVNDITVFGRAENCDFRIQDGAISREHFQLRVEVGAISKLFITDLGSRNGTFINQGNRLPRNEEQQLQIGDVITVTDHTYYVLSV